MKYKDSQGNFQDIYVKVGDNIPVGGEMDFDGDNIPVGWEEVDNPNNYSTNEQKIGTWIDGKPIYRKVYDISTITTSNTNLVDISSLKIENLIKLYGYIKDSYTGMLPIPLTDSSSNYSVILYNGQYIRGRCALGSGGAVSSAYAIIEYTKTTD